MVNKVQICGNKSFKFRHRLSLNYPFYEAIIQSTKTAPCHLHILQSLLFVCERGLLGKLEGLKDVPWRHRSNTKGRTALVPLYYKYIILRAKAKATIKTLKKLKLVIINEVFQSQCTMVLRYCDVTVPCYVTVYSRDVSDHQRHNQPQEGVHNDNGLKEIIPWMIMVGILIAIRERQLLS